jgi:hypothetical protein
MKERKDRFDPRRVKSSTDNELPKRAIPYVDTQLPSRMKDRSERELDMVTKSRTDKLDPNLAIPYAEKVDPSLMKDLKLNAEPSVT